MTSSKFTKTLIAASVVTGALLTAAKPATAAPASATASATAVVVPAIAISKTGDLAFGTLAPTGTAGSVVVTSLGALGTVTSVKHFGGTVSGATFGVTGQAAAGYAVTLPSSAVTLTGDAGGTMTVDTFTSSSTNTYVLTAGSDTVTVGGTLHVGATQATGTYTGTFDVTVAYN